MTTSYTPLLRLPIMTPGDPLVKNSWGAIIDTMMPLLDAAITGSVYVTLSGTTLTLTTANNAADQSRPAGVIFTGSPSAPVTVTIPGLQRFQWFRNGTNEPVTLTTGSGTTAILPPGPWCFTFCDGGDVGVIYNQFNNVFSGGIALLASGTSGTWTLPTGATALKFRMWGAGGQGGAGNTGGGGGGAGGGYAEGIFTSLSAGTSYSYSVGSGASGGAGGSTTFGSLTAGGGGAGSAGQSTGFVGPGSESPGFGNSSNFNVAGGSGGDGFWLSSSMAIGGAGGDSFGSSGGAQRIGPSGTPVIGTYGTSPGGGGGGGIGSGTGGLGGNGLIILEW